MDGTPVNLLSLSVRLCTLRPESSEKQQSTWTEPSPIFSCHFQSCCVLCGRNRRKNSKVHGRNARQFFAVIFSPAVYSAARFVEKTAKYTDRTLANFLCSPDLRNEPNRLRRGSKNDQEGSLGDPKSSSLRSMGAPCGLLGCTWCPHGTHMDRFAWSLWSPRRKLESYVEKNRPILVSFWTL